MRLSWLPSKAFPTSPAVGAAKYAGTTLLATQAPNVAASWDAEANASTPADYTAQSGY